MSYALDYIKQLLLQQTSVDYSNTVDVERGYDRI